MQRLALGILRQRLGDHGALRVNYQRAIDSANTQAASEARRRLRMLP